jgi:hypothetical protein
MLPPEENEEEDDRVVEQLKVQEREKEREYEELKRKKQQLGGEKQKQEHSLFKSSPYPMFFSPQRSNRMSPPPNVEQQEVSPFRSYAKTLIPPTLMTSQLPTSLGSKYPTYSTYDPKPQQQKTSPLQYVETISSQSSQSLVEDEDAKRLREEEIKMEGIVAKRRKALELEDASRRRQLQDTNVSNPELGDGYKRF